MLSSVEEALTVARLMREAGPPTSLTKRKRGREATLNAWRNETTTARFNSSFEHALGGPPGRSPLLGAFPRPPACPIASLHVVAPAWAVKREAEEDWGNERRR